MSGLKKQKRKLEGNKFDGGKNRLELIPPEFLEATGHVLTFGAQKYSDRNWEKGMDWSRCYGALLRHMNAWWSGEGFDPETGMSHLWHASCCIAFLTTYEQRGVGNDDRPEATKVVLTMSTCTDDAASSEEFQPRGNI